MIKLKYGNTNTFFINGLLIDTDYAGTMPAFYKAIRGAGIKTSDIKYVLATHYHPDHMGLMGQLVAQGAQLLLVDLQKEAVHFSDSIFKKDQIPFTPIDESSATVILCEESRGFLESIGIKGEIIHTPSHSNDSVSLILDDGICFAGDLEPLEYVDSYPDNKSLKSDWNKIMSFCPKMVYYAHRPEREVLL